MYKIVSIDNNGVYNFLSYNIISLLFDKFPLHGISRSLNVLCMTLVEFYAVISKLTDAAIAAPDYNVNHLIMLGI